MAEMMTGCFCLYGSQHMYASAFVLCSKTAAATKTLSRPNPHALCTRLSREGKLAIYNNSIYFDIEIIYISNYVNDFGVSNLLLVIVAYP